MALDEDRPLLRLLRGYPIDVVVEPGCGRLAVAARDLEPGEVVLESLCFAKTMTPASRKHWWVLGSALCEEAARLQLETVPNGGPER